MRLIEWNERAAVRSGAVPTHVALVMDGNRRWAASRGFTAASAHQAVGPALISTMEEARYLGVQYLTVFALAPRNLLRPAPERESLKRLREWLWSADVVKSLNSLNARVQLIGGTAHEWINQEAVELEPLRNPPDSALTVSFAVNHSARREMSCLTGGAGLGGESTADWWTPDIDLFVRTGGEQRLSDFMLWHLADAELVFTDTLWPDFRAIHLCSAVYEYQQRRRRFGR